MAGKSKQYVSRAGEKLENALDAFGLDVAGAICADFGCNIGGFTDCLLQRGAAKVYAVDTGYGALAWKLRKDGRVVVMERTNALYADPPEPVDLVVIDMAWTVQELAAPAAMKWLKTPAAGGREPFVVSLLKPHYELAKLNSRKPASAVTVEQARAVCLEICRRLEQANCHVRAVYQSALAGKGGNCEFMLLIQGPKFS